MSESLFLFIEALVSIVQGLFTSHVLHVLAICMACTGFHSLVVALCCVSCCPALGQSVSLCLLPCTLSLTFLPVLWIFLSLSLCHCPILLCPQIYMILGDISLGTESGGAHFLSLTAPCSHISPYHCKTGPAIQGLKKGWVVASPLRAGRPSTLLLLTVLLFPGARSGCSWGWLS